MQSLYLSIKYPLFIYLFAILTFQYPLAQASNYPTRETTTLAKCEFIYSYAGQYLLLKNNIGGALNLLRRASLMTTANFMLNATNEVVPREMIQHWTEIRAPIKQRFDTGQSSPIEEAAKCDKDALPFAINVRTNSTTLWGKNFDELHDLLFQRLKSSAGL